jgi:hypothetical protein
MKDYLEICKVCDHEFIHWSDRKGHLLNEHDLSLEKYVIYALFDDINPKCNCGCGKKTEFNNTKSKNWFNNLAKGCKTKFNYSEERKKEILEKRKQTNLEKFGVENPFQNENCKEKSKNTNIKRHGVEFPMQSKKIKVKSKKTNLKKFGVEFASQSKEFRKRVAETNLEKFGNTCSALGKEQIEKTKKTNLERFGVEYSFQAESVKEKLKETNIKRYGVQYPMKLEKFKTQVKKTKKKKYGDENYQNIEKIKRTNLEKYGHENIAQTDLIKKKNLEKFGYEHPAQNKEVQEKIKNTNIERYGVEHFFNIPHFKNNYHAKHSKKELEVCNILKGESGFYFNGKEYDIKIGDDILFEIDGDYVHSPNLLNLNLQQLGSTVNDSKKIKNLENTKYNLYKILISNLPKEITVENLIENSYIPNYLLSNDDVIMSKEYIEKYIVNNGREKFNRTVYKFKNFVWEFAPNVQELKDEEVLINGIKNVLGMAVDNEIKDFTINNLLNS